MTVHLDFRQLLWAAEQLPGDPQVDDYGAVFIAAERAKAEAFGYEVYGSATLKAAALMQTIALLQPLERSNRAFGFGVARAFLVANGLRIKPKPDELREPMAGITPGAAGVRAIAEQLAQWIIRPEIS